MTVMVTEHGQLPGENAGQTSLDVNSRSNSCVALSPFNFGEPRVFIGKTETLIPSF